jgi:hypothetical protein
MQQTSAFLDVGYECGQCKRRGYCEVVRHQGESDKQLARRFQQDTRARCVDGCRFLTTAGAESAIKTRRRRPR